MGIFAAYSINWSDPGSGSYTMFTSDPISPGFNVFTSIDLSRFRVLGEDANGIAGIYKWEAYNAAGQPVTAGGDSGRTTRNCLFIDNCRSVTYILYSGGCMSVAQISLSTV